VTTAEKYVTAAYLVVFVVVLAYVLIISTKLARLEREVAELEELARRRRDADAEVRKAVAIG
jgi:CcmD family protein